MDGMLESPCETGKLKSDGNFCESEVLADVEFTADFDLRRLPSMTWHKA